MVRERKSVKIDVRELGQSRVRVHISLDASEVDQAFRDTYQSLSERGGIKGFRPGKVPRGILERHYEPDAIRAGTYEKLLEERLREAFEQAEVRPIEQVRIEVGPPPEDEDAEIAASIKAKLGIEDAQQEQQEPRGEAQREAAADREVVETQEPGDEDPAPEAEAEAQEEEQEEGPPVSSQAEDSVTAEEPAAEDEAQSEEPEAAEDDEAEGAQEEIEEEEREEDEEEDIPLVEGEPFEFHTTFTAYPRPKLPEYRGLKLRRPVAEVTDEEVEAQFQRLRDLNATEVEVDRSTVGEGDLVLVDLGVKLADQDAEEDPESDEQERELIIGQREYDPPIDQELLGHVVGQTVELPVDYPEDHPDPELAGKQGTMRATIKSLKGRELPEPTDEFAQSLGDYECLEDLRESIRSQLEEANDEYADRELREQVLREIVENTEVELPEVLVEQAAQRSFEGFMGDLERVGISLEGFTEAAGMDEEALQANQRARAEGALKLHFALQAIADREEIEVTDEDIQEEIERYARESDGEISFIQEAAAIQEGFADELRERAVVRKLVDVIVDAADIEDVPREAYEAEDGEEEAEQDDEDDAAEGGEQESEGN
jgi:trigger factor